MYLIQWQAGCWAEVVWPLHSKCIAKCFCFECLKIAADGKDGHAGAGGGHSGGHREIQVRSYIVFAYFPIQVHWLSKQIMKCTPQKLN